MHYGSTEFLVNVDALLWVLSRSGDTEHSNYVSMLFLARGILFDDISLCKSLCPEAASFVQKDKECALVCGKEVLPDYIPSSV